MVMQSGCVRGNMEWRKKCSEKNTEESRKVGFIGAGRMGSALVRAFIKPRGERKRGS